MNRKILIPVVLTVVIIFMIVVSTIPKDSMHPSKCGNSKKWNPGHYLLPTKARTIEEIEAVLSNPNNHITGVKMGYWWRELEPEKDGYDFSEIEKHLALVRKYDKQLFMYFGERAFNSDDNPLPDYLYEDPQYNGGVEPWTTKDGCVARLWDPAVMERMNKLIRELGKFDNDPHFEGIIFPESALDINTKTAPGYSKKALVEGMISRIDTACEAFPNSVVIQYMNWGPPELAEVIEHLYTVGAGMGGPDLVPDAGKFPEKQRIPAYDFYPVYAGKMPLGIAVETPNLLKDNEKGDFTLDGFWDMGLNTLELNYIFWAFVEEKRFKFSFSEDILPYINEREGEINDACPENRSANGYLLDKWCCSHGKKTFIYYSM